IGGASTLSTLSTSNASPLVAPKLSLKPTLTGTPVLKSLKADLAALGKLAPAAGGSSSPNPAALSANLPNRLKWTPGSKLKQLKNALSGAKQSTSGDAAA